MEGFSGSDGSWPGSGGGGAHSYRHHYPDKIVRSRTHNDSQSYIHTHALLQQTTWYDLVEHGVDEDDLTTLMHAFIHDVECNYNFYAATHLVTQVCEDVRFINMYTIEHTSRLRSQKTGLTRKSSGVDPQRTKEED